jgi:EAL domain-containing protein (putative c-di-GMP-specific phosphodiesterase class I)
LDRYVVSGLHQSFHRQAVTRSLSVLAREVGAKVVAKGVEDRQDLMALRDLGVGLAQGHLFSPPVTPELLGATGFLANCGA